MVLGNLRVLGPHPNNKPAHKFMYVMRIVGCICGGHQVRPQVCKPSRASLSPYSHPELPPAYIDCGLTRCFREARDGLARPPMGNLNTSEMSELLNIDHPCRALLPQLPQLSSHRMRLYTFVGSNLGALDYTNPRAVAAAHL